MEQNTSGEIKKSPKCPSDTLKVSQTSIDSNDSTQSRLKKGDQITVVIDRLAKGGFGVARHEGFVIFVPFSAPGDRIEIEIVDLKPNFGFGEIKKILKPGSSRREAVCSVYGVCGGCNWQHISYEEQLRQKQQIIQWTFRDKKVENIIPSPDEWNYRRRIQLHHKNGKIGFLKRGSHELVEVHSCPIALKELLAAWPKPDTNLGEKFELRLSMVNDNFSNDRVNQDDLDSELNQVEVINDIDYPEFSQVNIEQNENLKKIVVQFVGTTLADADETLTKIYDIYCGSGNFTFPLAKKFPQLSVIGIDSNLKLIEKALAQIQTIATPASFGAEADVRKSVFQSLSFIQKRDDQILSMDFSGSIIVLDPPRTGCSSKLLQQLLKTRPLGIVYVSCDSQTARRDFKILEASFSVEKILPLDMFPQTDHVEIVGLLR